MEIAVGTAITGRPPHRSVRAELPHTAPTLDIDESRRIWDQVASIPLSRCSYAKQSMRLEIPALCPDQYQLFAVLLGQSPFLHRLRSSLRSRFVRLLPRYYETV